MRGAALTRRVRFSATHRYHRPEWTEAQNVAAFGPCAAPEPHGHDYTCDVTVVGEVDPTTGMVVDLGLLDRVIHDEVVFPLHGRLVNDAFAVFKPGGMIPTCEVLARVIAERIGSAMLAAGSPSRVQAVRVAEDDTLSASWTADA